MFRDECVEPLKEGNIIDTWKESEDSFHEERSGSSWTLQGGGNSLLEGHGPSRPVLQAGSSIRRRGTWPVPSS